VELRNEFEVPASQERAWAFLNDVPQVVPCMPGAELTEMVDENSFKATVHVKLGPVALQFATDVQREVVEAGRKVALTTSARDVKGRGAARAKIDVTLEPAASGTHVGIDTDLHLQGAVVQYARGIVPDVARQMTKQFSECVASHLTEEAATADGEPRPAVAAAPHKPVAIDVLHMAPRVVVNFWMRVLHLRH
jgi:carbon monoxide dehydrogenase subunit G